MTKELRKRIITSVLLFLFAIFCIFINYIIFFIAVIIVSYFAFDEISFIIYRTIRSISNWKHLVFNSVSIFYAFGIFSATAIGIYRLSGPVFFLYILSICICSDLGGYIIGKTIGGKKLTKISPKKTISGSVGSFCFSILPLLIFNNFDKSEYLYSVNNFLFCLELSLVCQLGDLFISYLKRKAKIKDTGKILPGHGGLLDRIDGIIFAVPFAYIYTIGINNYFDIWIEAIPYTLKSK